MRIDLGSGVSVLIEAGEEKPCSYTVLADDETIVGYETSADIRTPAGLIGLRNVVVRRVDGLEKESVETELTAAVDRQAAAIDETLGSR